MKKLLLAAAATTAIVTGTANVFADDDTFYLKANVGGSYLDEKTDRLVASSKTNQFLDNKE